jgi:hypothetical protein
VRWRSSRATWLAPIRPSSTGVIARSAAGRPDRAHAPRVVWAGRAARQSPRRAGRSPPSVPRASNRRPCKRCRGCIVQSDNICVYRAVRRLLEFVLAYCCRCVGRSGFSPDLSQTLRRDSVAPGQSAGWQTAGSPISNRQRVCSGGAPTRGQYPGSSALG